MLKRRLIHATIVVCAVAALGGAVLATPGSGIVSARVFARAAFAEAVDLKFKIGGDPVEVLHVPNAQDTVVQQVVIAPGGTTGWHSHPGPVVVLIASGEMKFYSGDSGSCSAITYTAGQAFVDSGQGHVHTARNEGTENLVIWATYFDVPPGQPFRIDAANPGNCGF